MWCLIILGQKDVLDVWIGTSAIYSVCSTDLLEASKAIVSLAMYWKGYILHQLGKILKVKAWHIPYIS